ncbi:Tetracycline repressor protein class E [Corynebacterium capitovis DSM 44611]|nr:Tetracycline repressor protein class E [Corynebacterium capitovis DSM 44611]
MNIAGGKVTPMHLSRDVIGRAALGILDEYGLADVTMRRVATSLSVAPGALYWHIKNKQELISHLAELITAPLFDASRAASTPAVLCAELRRVLLAHRDGAEVVLAALSQTESPLTGRLTELVRGSLGTASDNTTDSATARAEAAAEGLVYLTVGAAYVHQSSAQLAQATGSPAPAGDVASVELAVEFLLAGYAQHS